MTIRQEKILAVVSTTDPPRRAVNSSRFRYPSGGCLFAAPERTALLFSVCRPPTANSPLSTHTYLFRHRRPGGRPQCPPAKYPPLFSCVCLFYYTSIRGRGKRSVPLFYPWRRRKDPGPRFAGLRSGDRGFLHYLILGRFQQQRRRRRLFWESWRRPKGARSRLVCMERGATAAEKSEGASCVCVCV